MMVSIRAISSVPNPDKQKIRFRFVLSPFFLFSFTLDGTIDERGTHFRRGQQHGLENDLEASAGLQLDLGQQIDSVTVIVNCLELHQRFL